VLQLEIELVCTTTELLQSFKYEGREGDEHIMKMHLKGINNDESKLMILLKFCRIVIISRAVACYR
jgi:hypothetical protein